MHAVSAYLEDEGWWCVRSRHTFGGMHAHINSTVCESLLCPTYS